MKRSQNPELTRRINHAYVLLNKEQPQPRIVEHLMKLYGISPIQAYRYIQQARENNGQVAIPEVSVVFTVKQPPSLTKRVKQFARSAKMPVSRVVRTALEEYLAKEDHGKKGETG
jgi:hypothetical protein